MSAQAPLAGAGPDKDAGLGQSAGLDQSAGQSQSESVQRVLSLQLLCPEHPERWSRDELARALRHIDPGAIEAALRELIAVGIVTSSQDGLAASPALRRLDALELIGA